jgi:hypothetical protein
MFMGAYQRQLDSSFLRSRRIRDFRICDSELADKSIGEEDNVVDNTGIFSIGNLGYLRSERIG